MQYIRLIWQRRLNQAASIEAERRLNLVAMALHRYAEDHDGLLPDELDQLKMPLASELVYRPVPRMDTDGKLIVLHDVEPKHQVIEFPSLRAARGVVFASGRMRIVTEEAFEKLVAADRALRERIGLRDLDE
jgi:hypothetical protein